MVTLRLIYQLDISSKPFGGKQCYVVCVYMHLAIVHVLSLIVALLMVLTSRYVVAAYGD